MDNPTSPNHKYTTDDTILESLGDLIDEGVTDRVQVFQSAVHTVFDRMEQEIDCYVAEPNEYDGMSLEQHLRSMLDSWRKQVAERI